MKKAIVTTTINEPTKAILRYIEIGARDGWTLFIVGDKKTPHESYLKLAQAHPHVAYISPEKQASKYGRLSELIGWNCIQRRNFGFIEAYNWGAEIIATIDDDNIPYDNWGQLLAVGDEPLVAVHQSQDLVFDPFQATNARELWHRGFPIQLLNWRSRATYIGHLKRPRCLVQADFWDGEPDVDAVCRIAKGPFDCQFTHERFAGTAPGPFNSQNTFLHRDVFPTYFMFPHVGRMDDIWASYIVQKRFPDSVVYGSASVYQERNDHDLSKDLEAEMLGNRHTLDFVKRLFDPRSDHDEGSYPDYLPDSAIAAHQEYMKHFKLSTANPQGE
jgi:hypothetical protein